MYENEKAPTGVGASVEAGTDRTACRGTSVSGYQFSMDDLAGQVRVVDFLPRGAASAIPSKKLAQMVGAPSVRALQAMIAAECERDGALILSRGAGGYFLPSNDPVERRRELLPFERTLDARARHTQARLKAVRRALRVAEGQQQIGEA